MFILQVFLVRGAVFHPDAFAFQIVKRVEGIFLRDNQRGVSVVRVGERHLLAALGGNIHAGNDRIIFLEFERRDQAVESMVGKSTLGLHLFAQRVRQVDVETGDLVIGVHGFKRWVSCRNAKAYFFCGSGTKGERAKQCGQN